jgi:outer membrane biosynthesis protein TonB
MSAKNRADLITKLHKFVKKEYQVITPPSNRSVLEHMIYGCCLENSNFDAADDAFAKLQENYFDWNEVRVTTVAELAESCRNLSDPTAAARSLKKTLHGIFEHYYQFDLDFLKKENLSKAVQTFQKFNGVSQFVVSYVAQNGLGGHSIPLDHSLMRLFYVLGIVTEDESKKDRVPGLERTIAKAKGAEFSILVHQLAVAFNSAPFSTALRAKILKVNGDAKERFPKRASRKKEPEKKAPAKKEPVKKVVKEVAKKAPTKAPTKAKPVANKAKKKVVKKATTKPVAKPAKKATTKPAKKASAKSAKKASAKSAKKASAKPAKKAKVTKKVTKKKSPTKRLSKKKPR